MALYCDTVLSNQQVLKTVQSNHAFTPTVQSNHAFTPTEQFNHAFTPKFHPELNHSPYVPNPHLKPTPPQPDPISSQQVDEIMKDIDFDNDGYLSFTEFSKCIALFQGK